MSEAACARAAWKVIVGGRRSMSSAVYTGKMLSEFSAFLRCFSEKREKDQVSIGSGWWQWKQQASARVHSTVRSAASAAALVSRGCSPGVNGVTGFAAAAAPAARV